MKAENLVNKEKLLAIIEKIGKAPWKKGEGVEKLIPLGAVMLAIESPAQAVSPAELAKQGEEDRRKAEILKKLGRWLKEYYPPGKGICGTDCQITTGIVLDKIKELLAQGEESETR